VDKPKASERGQLIRRALDLQAALKLGVHVDLDEIRADEFFVMLTVEEDRVQVERERLPRDWGSAMNGPTRSVGLRLTLLQAYESAVVS